MLVLLKSGDILNPVVTSNVYWVVVMSTKLYHIDVWGTCEKDVKYLESIHKNMARIVHDLPWGVACARMQMSHSWFSVEVMVWKKRA